MDHDHDRYLNALIDDYTDACDCDDAPTHGECYGCGRATTAPDGLCGPCSAEDSGVDLYADGGL